MGNSGEPPTASHEPHIVYSLKRLFKGRSMEQSTFRDAHERRDAAEINPGAQPGHSGRILMRIKPRPD